MELLIQPDQFIIKYPPVWMFVLLLSGLILFFTSKFLRERLKHSGKHSFIPAVLFTVSFIFIIGGINLYVYKVVFNKDGIILFNIQHFNQQINWQDINRVDYRSQQQIHLYVSEDGDSEQQKSFKIDLTELDEDSMDKVQTLIEYKTKKANP